MEDEQKIRSLPDRPRRHCPECGARVADGAKTCLMCGTPLPELDAEPEKSGASSASEQTTEGRSSGSATPVLGDSKDEAQRLKPLRIAVLALIAVIILSGAVVVGMRLSSGEISPELPTFTPTVTHTPTITASPTMTPTPTETPPPTLTPTPVPPTEYVVLSGDTLLAIALEYDLTIGEIMAYNGMESDVIVEGQTLLIPPPTPTPGPTPTLEPGVPTNTPSPFTLHTVRSGDTLSTIAEQYGISMDTIRAANDIPTDSETIQVNTVLTIPSNTPTPQPETIVAVTPTATPGISSYPEPSMLYPPDGATFTGSDAVIALQWASVGILDDREFYQVELIVPTDGQKTTHQTTLRSTVWRVPAELFPPESVEDRVVSWRVFVVRQVTEGPDSDYKVISLAPRRNSFSWIGE